MEKGLVYHAEDYVHGRVMDSSSEKVGLESVIVIKACHTIKSCGSGDNKFFGTLRKTEKMDGPVVCIFNLTKKLQKIMLPVGLMEFTVDKLTDEVHHEEKITFRTYQGTWLVTEFYNA